MANAKARTNSRVQNFAQKGRFGDNRAAHVQDGEIVVPKKVWMADPSLAQHASQAISAMGADPRAYVVGHPANNINPRTGAREFALQYTDQGWIDPAAGYNAPIDFSTYNPAGGNQTAPEQSGSASPAPGTPKQANANWGPAPGSDAYYAQRAQQWEGAPAQSAPSFGFGGQNEMSASVTGGGAKQPNADWGFGSASPTPSTGGQWGSPDNSAINQQIAQATGYGGQFGSGGFDSWINTQSPETQLKAAGILQNAGQANRITWGNDYNGNGTVEGTEAPGVQQNDDGTFTFPGGYIKGNHPNPITSGNPIYQMANPGIEGAPPSYAYGGGQLAAGAWPSDFMDARLGVTGYNAAPTPLYVDANGIAHWQNDAFLPTDVRNGGTGDPYNPWTKEWAAQQAAAGNGYAAQSLGADAASLIPGATSGNIGAVLQGQGTSAGQAAGQPKPAFRFGGGMAWQYPDGTFVTDEGFKMLQTPNGLWYDTGRGVYRNGSGTIVDQSGRVIPGINNMPQGSFDYQRLYGGEANTQNLAWIGGNAPQNLFPGGREQPIVGPYGAALGLAQTSIPGVTSTPTTSGQYGTGYPTTTGTPGTTTTPTTTPTQSGLGLTPGTANPYSVPYGYSSPIINILGGSNGSGSGSGTISPDILSLIASLNLGYGAGTYGTPYYQSQGVDTTGGGIQTTTPNSETVDFRPSFGY